MIICFISLFRLPCARAACLRRIGHFCTEASHFSGGLQITTITYLVLTLAERYISSFTIMYNKPWPLYLRRALLSYNSSLQVLYNNPIRTPYTRSIEDTLSLKLRPHWLCIYINSRKLSRNIPQWLQLTQNPLFKPNSGCDATIGMCVGAKSPQVPFWRRTHIYSFFVYNVHR